MIDDDQICYEDDLCDLLNQSRVETSFGKNAECVLCTRYSTLTLHVQIL